MVVDVSPRLSRTIAALPMLMVLATMGAATAQRSPSVAPPGPPRSTPSHAPADPAVETLDIRDFGARCDGNTDDYAAIAAALAHAGNHAGGVVSFPPSSKPCMVSHALKVPDNVTLRAAAGTVTVKATSDNMSSPMLLAVGNNVRVDGLSFDGGGGDHPNAANVIQGYKVSNVVFDSIAVRHTRGIGLLMSSNIVNSTVHNSIFEDLGNHWKASHEAKDRIQGVVFCCGTGNRGNAATNNQFSDIGLDALQFSDQSEIAVMGNRFNLENGQHAMMAAPDFPAAIFPFHIDRAMITDNVIAGAQGNCIDAPGLTNATISRNTLTGCGSAGIGLFDSHTYPGPIATTDHVMVSNNTITNNGRWEKDRPTGGVTFGGKVTNVSLVGNTVTDMQLVKTQMYAVYGVVGSTLTGLSIDSSNRIDGNAKSAFGGTVSADSHSED